MFVDPNGKYIAYSTEELPYGYAGGTHLQGYISCSYSALVKYLGEPGLSDGYKSDAEWIVHDEENNVIATVYNYKNGRNYLGSEGVPVSYITEWHVGGNDKEAMSLIEEILFEG